MLAYCTIVVDDMNEMTVVHFPELLKHKEITNV